MKRLLVEFIGTFMLAFAAGNALVSQHPLAAVAAGAALMIATCFGCAISGAHFNPAVSLAAWRRGRLGKSELLTYMAAQLIGAILAALFTQVVQGAVIEEFAKAAVATAMKGGPAPKLSSIFIAEFAWTSVLAYVLLQVSTTKRAESPVVFGLIIGLTLTTGGIALASVSGGVVNPALFVALCILGVKNWSSILVFLGAQCLGALVAGELFRRTNPDEAA